MRGPLPTAVVMLALLIACAAPPARGEDEAVQAFAARLSEAAQWDAAHFSERADAFGKLVSAARDAMAAAPAQQRLRELGDELHAACRARIRALEAATGEDEAKLEDLYRSQQWYEINYALAAVRYWQAWIDLALAGTAADDAARVPALSRAERGFQSTAVRILYPGLVYGSWLGMAYVERARGDDAAAQKRLELLAGALATDPDNPLAKLVADELALLAVRRGEAVSPLPAGKGKLEPALARRLQEEAFALLEERRSEGIAALEAAERLRRLIDAGYLDDALLARMLAWRDELVGRDLGTVGLLLDAEYAAAHEQYETTVLKYREFAAKGGFELPINTAAFRYNYAVALHRLGYEREALEVAMPLREDRDVGPAARKLVFLAAERRNREQPGAANRAALTRAASEFLASSPDDEDAAFAHLALAGGGDAAARTHLAAARRDARTRAAVEGVRLDAAVAAFTDAAARNDLAARASAARAALAAIDALPRAERRTLPLRVLALQLRVAAGTCDERIPDELQELREAAGADPALVRVLVWTALRALSGEALLAHVAALPQPPAAAEADELVAFLQEREQARDYTTLAAVAERAVPVFATQPDVARQLVLMRHRALTALGRDAEAFAIALGLVQSYPDSGDAWFAYASSAERSGDIFAADRGWARIAAATPEGSDRWLDATLRRVALLSRTAGAQAAHCDLLARADLYRERMNAALGRQLAQLERENRCDG
jgi:hypothetical protein